MSPGEHSNNSAPPGLLATLPLCVSLKAPALFHRPRQQQTTNRLSTPTSWFLFSPLHAAHQPNTLYQAEPLRISYVGPALGVPELTASLLYILVDVRLIVYHQVNPEAHANCLSGGRAQVDGPRSQENRGTL